VAHPNPYGTRLPDPEEFVDIELPSWMWGSSAYPRNLNPFDNTTRTEPSQLLPNLYRINPENTESNRERSASSETTKKYKLDTEVNFFRPKPNNHWRYFLGMTAVSTGLLIATATLGGLLAVSNHTIKDLQAAKGNATAGFPTLRAPALNITHISTITSSATTTQNFTTTRISLSTLPPLSVTSIITEKVTVMVTQQPNVTVEITCSHKEWTESYDFFCNAEKQSCSKITKAGVERRVLERGRLRL
jgi:hypothetical protein